MGVERLIFERKGVDRKRCCGEVFEKVFITVCPLFQVLWQGLGSKGKMLRDGPVIL